MSQMVYIILLPFFLKSQLFAPPPIDSQEFSAYIKEQAHMEQVYKISHIHWTSAMTNDHQNNTQSFNCIPCSISFVTHL